MSLRKRASLLRSAGHPHVDYYAYSELMFESDIVLRRIRGEDASRALLQQLAVASLLDKDAAKGFRDIVTRYTTDA